MINNLIVEELTYSELKSINGGRLSDFGEWLTDVLSTAVVSYRKFSYKYIPGPNAV